MVFTTRKRCRVGNFIVEPNAVIYDDCEIGEGSVIGTGAVLKSRTKIGKNTLFGTLSVSEGDNKVGDNCTIHAQVHLTKGLTIGNNVFIAPFFLMTNTPEITTGEHGTSKNTKPYEWLYGVIEDNVRIGGCVSIIPGITIGHDSLIFQNTLITKDIPPFSIVKAGKDHVGRIIGRTD